MNDPNGLLYHDGKYHLFYQHNPLGNLWGNMSWGHAISGDLYSWEHLPVAIPYDENFGIFSGSAVADYRNSSGFGSSTKPPLVAIYTAHKHDGTHQAQHLAYSLDEGAIWIKYADNPVLDLGMKDFRDPKVTYEEATNTWLMTIAKPEEHKIAFFRSHNLKSWEHLSDFGPLGATGGCWECPDLFPLTLDDGSIKWVLLISLNPGGISGGSGTQYFIGEWDGTTFTPDLDQEQWIDYGRDNYAGVTFNNAPENKRIFIGWMSNWLYADKYPTTLWRSSMTTPRELTLRRINGIPTLISTPITPPTTVITKTFTITTSNDFEFTITNQGEEFSIFFNASSKQIELTRSWFVEDKPQISPQVNATSFELHILIDNGSCELFAPAIGLTMTSLTLLPIEGISENYLL
jgi:levanase/fructan beta-fructosidase